MHFAVSYFTVTIIACDHVTLTLCAMESARSADPDATESLNATLGAVRSGLRIRTANAGQRMGGRNDKTGDVGGNEYLEQRAPLTALAPVAMLAGPPEQYQSFPTPSRPKKNGSR